ncbi:hypothetical protein MMC14_003148, partial [Varicellaria rhodocarpa]|nr:hypothetical protein [Varicellaria rhodocarpa]
MWSPRVISQSPKASLETLSHEPKFITGKNFISGSISEEVSNLHQYPVHVPTRT